MSSFDILACFDSSTCEVVPYCSFNLRIFDDFFFWLCWILAPLPGMDPGPLAAKTQSPNHWDARKFSLMTMINIFLCVYCLSICASLTFFYFILEYS